MSVKSENPFLVQERRIETLALINRAIRRQDNLAIIHKPTVSLHEKAKTVLDGDITSDDFVNFLEKIESVISTMVVIPLPPQNKRTSIDETNIIQLRTDLVPLWVSQFKRMRRKALKEGKISALNLSAFEKELKNLVAPFMTEKDFDDTKTATYTNAQFDNPFFSSGKTTTDEIRPMPLFPKGTTARMAQEINFNNVNPLVQKFKDETIIDEKLRLIQNMINEVDRMKAVSISQNFANILQEINLFMRQLQEYHTNVEIGEDNINEEYEEVLRQTYKSITKKFNDQVEIAKEDLKTLNTLRNMYKNISIKWSKAKYNYNTELNQGQHNTVLRVDIESSFRKFANDAEAINNRLDKIGNTLKTFTNPRKLETITARSVATDLAGVSLLINQWSEYGAELRKSNKEATDKAYRMGQLGMTEEEADDAEDYRNKLAQSYFDEENEEDEEEAPYKGVELPDLEEDDGDENDDDYGMGMRKKVKKPIKKPIKKAVKIVNKKPIKKAVKQIEKGEKNKNFHVIKF